MLEELVGRYMDTLDAGTDDAALYEQIKRLSRQLSQMSWLETAEVARVLYYRRKAEAHEEELLSRLDAVLESTQRSDAQKGPTLSEYFNRIVASLRLDWPSILRQMGISPNQSRNFRKDGAPFTALMAPDRLAWLTKRLQADSAAVLRLARCELEIQQPPAATSVSYRVFKGFRKAGVDLHGEPSSEKILAYLGSLEHELRAELGGP